MRAVRGRSESGRCEAGGGGGGGLVPRLRLDMFMREGMETRGLERGSNCGELGTLPTVLLSLRSNENTDEARSTRGDGDVAR